MYMFKKYMCIHIGVYIYDISGMTIKPLLETDEPLLVFDSSLPMSGQRGTPACTRSMMEPR